MDGVDSTEDCYQGKLCMLWFPEVVIFFCLGEKPSWLIREREIKNVTGLILYWLEACPCYWAKTSCHANLFV